MALILADNPMFTTIRGDFFNYSLSTENKESHERREFVLNNKQSKLESLSRTAIRQSNAFSIPVIVGIVPAPRLPEYHYNYRYENKGFVVRRLLRQPNELIISAKNRILLQEMLSEIESLLKNEYDWDEIDYRKPTPEDISRAKSVLKDFVSTIDSNGYSVKKPYISNSENGGANIEWDTDERSLYMEITQHDSVITKIWDELDRSVIDTEPLQKENYLPLWKWIINEQ